MAKIIVQNTQITVIKQNEDDYISLTDMLKAKDGEFFFSNWLRNRNTIEFLGIWERLMNPNFNCAEFENFAKGNNSVTDTKRRMRDSPTLRQSTSWPSDGEGHVRWQRTILLSERSMVNEECPSTRKGTMQWKSKTEEREKRLGMFGYKLSC